jgi:hypothetical protein
MSRMLLAAGLAIVGIATIGSAAARAANVINFDPNGTAGDTTFAVASLDEAPGNALAVDVLDENGNLRTGTPFELLYQARVAALRDANNNSLAVPGQDTAGELTIVASFFEVATGSNGAAVFSTDTDQTGSFLRIYFDPANDSNDLTGTGFDNGTLIYEGVVLRDGGGAFAEVPGVTDLDQFGDNDYSGIQTVRGAGGTIINVATTSFDPNFFLGPLPVFTISFNTSNVTPFSQVDPAAMMFNGEAAANGGIGTLNGRSGPSFLFQADATASFTVIPEPTSVLLLSVGLVGAVGYRMRRRPKAA